MNGFIYSQMASFIVCGSIVIQQNEFCTFELIEFFYEMLLCSAVYWP